MPSPYETKNAARKAGRANGSVGERRTAKVNRRLVAGAFGMESTEFQEACLAGTTGRVSSKAGSKPKPKWEQAKHEVIS